MQIQTCSQTDPVYQAAKRARHHFRWTDEALRERDGFAAAKYPPDAVRKADNKARHHDRAAGDSVMQSLRREPTTYRGVAYQLAFVARGLRGQEPTTVIIGSALVSNDEVANELAAYAWAFARRRAPKRVVDRLIMLRRHAILQMAIGEFGNEYELLGKVLGKTISGLAGQKPSREGGAAMGPSQALSAAT